MKLEFGYGKGIQEVEVPDGNLLAVLRANPLEHERRGEEAVRYALEHPIGAGLLREDAAAKMEAAGGPEHFKDVCRPEAAA